MGVLDRQSVGRVCIVGLSPAIVLVAVVYPAAGVVWGIVRGMAKAGVLPIPVGYSLLWPTLAWCGLIAALATVVALPAAWVMRGWRGAAPFLLVPLLLPSYLAYSGWGMLRAPGTWLGDWLMRGPGGEAGGNWWPVAAGRVQAVVGLTLWVWPLAALVMGAAFSRVDEAVLEQLRVDGARPWQRVAVVLRMTRDGVVAAAAVVFLVMLGSAVPLHLAQVETYTMVIWRLLDELPWEQRWRVWVAAWPLVAVAAGAGVMLTRRVVEGRIEEFGGAGTARRRVTPAIIGAAVVWGLAVAAPLVIVAANLNGVRPLVTFWRLSAGSIAASAQVAAAVAGLTLVVIAAVWLGAESRARWMRWLAAACLGALLVAGLTPGILVGAATAQVWNQWGGGATQWLADSPAIVVLGHVARFGFVAALAGWFLARSEPGALRDLRRIDAGEAVRGWVEAAAWPRMGVVTGVAVACGVLSCHEIESAVMLQPPASAGGGFAWRVLQALHYSREEDVVAAMATVLGVGVIGAGIVAGLVRRRR